MNTTTDDGTAIFWTETGDPWRPAIVMLHSLGADAGMWKPQIEAFAADYRVVAIDTRGHGRSGVPAAPYALERLGHDVIEVVDAVGIDRFHVCGVSLGGQTALWLGVNRAERLLSLTASNTAAKIGDDTKWDTRIDAVRSGGLASIRDAVVSRWFSPDFAERHPDWLDEVRATFDSTDAEGYIGCCAALAGADLRQEVAGIDLPTLVIGGTLDVSTPPDQAEWLHSHIDRSQLEIIDEAGHVSNLDRSEAFTRRLGQFLDQL